MTKLVRVVVLMMALGVVAVPATISTAQDKKEKKSTKKAKEPGTIEVGESKNGKFYFTIRNGEGKYLCGSTPIYTSKDEVKKAIEELKEVLVDAKMKDKK